MLMIGTFPVQTKVLLEIQQFFRPCCKQALTLHSKSLIPLLNVMLE